MPLAARNSKASFKLSGSVLSGDRNTSTPLASSLNSASCGAPVPASTHTGTSRALRTSREVSGRRSMLSATTRTGEYFAMPGKRQVKQRIVGERRADADHDGIALRPQQMHALAHRLAGDGDRLAPGRAGFAVGGDRELEQDMRTAFGKAKNVTGVVAPRLIGADADLDGNARGAKPRVTLPCHFRIGIFQRRHHPRNAGGNHRIGAGRRFAVMRAGFERDVERRTARGLACPAQRLDLGMRPAAGLGPAAADNHAILDDHRADRRIGPGAAKPAPAERKRQRHEAEQSSMLCATSR